MAASPHTPQHIDSGVAIGLCLVNALACAVPALESRILVVKSPTPFVSSKLIAAAFSAQQAHVAIDALTFGPAPDTPMQQTSFISRGVFYHFPPELVASVNVHSDAGSAARVTEHEWLTQVLLSHFAAGPTTRRMFAKPPLQQISFSAMCAIPGCPCESVELGYMCSVCLAVVCRPVERCPVCGTEPSGGVLGLK